MKHQKTGVVFHETMQGPFALNAADPHIGAGKGREEVTQLKITCTIDVCDITSFIADPDHHGRISGFIDFKPFGSCIRAPSGVFKLFTPTGDSVCKQMVYEFAFTHDGQNYYLAGHKEICKGPLYHLWRDTTTLFTTLHLGNDPTGSVVGAGILTIGLGNFAKLVLSIRVIHASSIICCLHTLFQFGHFFLNELWNTYVPDRRIFFVLFNKKNKL